jgi:hypothetical protein
VIQEHGNTAPALIIVSTGTEVQLAVKTAKALAAEGVSVRYKMAAICRMKIDGSVNLIYNLELFLCLAGNYLRLRTWNIRLQ